MIKYDQLDLAVIEVIKNRRKIVGQGFGNIDILRKIDEIRFNDQKSFYELFVNPEETKDRFCSGLKVSYNEWTFPNDIILGTSETDDYLATIFPTNSKIYVVNDCTGVLPLKLAKSGLMVTFSELADEKIKIARKNRKQNDLNFQIEEAYTFHPKAYDNSYDYVIFDSPTMYSFVIDPVTDGTKYYATIDYKFQRLIAIFREADFVLKKGGKLVVTVKGVINGKNNYLESKKNEYVTDIGLVLAKEFGYQVVDNKVLEFRNEGEYSFSEITTFQRKTEFQGLFGTYQNWL